MADAEKLPLALLIVASEYAVEARLFWLVPYTNLGVCGAYGDVLTQLNVAVRVAPDVPTFPALIAVMFPSPEVPPPDPLQLFTPQMTNRLPPLAVNVKAVSVVNAVLNVITL